MIRFLSHLFQKPPDKFHQMTSELIIDYCKIPTLFINKFSVIVYFYSSAVYSFI